MFMRIFRPLLLLLAFAACDNRPDNDVLAEVEERAAAQPADDGRIECAINGDTSFTRGCETERLSGEDGVTLIIRHPDGGFRRFRVLTDGRGLEAADGSVPARIEIVENDKIRVSIGPDRYILPARMKPTDEPGGQAGN